MIGLSVSSCFAAMARGEVDPATVEKIVARTACETDAGWERVMSSYKLHPWSRSIADEACRLATEFWKAGKIGQPRLIDGTMPDISNGIWVESEDQIVYIPYPY
jgi:hypothetical protein